jgi:hypothetical protein
MSVNEVPLRKGEARNAFGTGDARKIDKAQIQGTVICHEYMSLSLRDYSIGGLATTLDGVGKDPLISSL